MKKAIVYLTIIFIVIVLISTYFSLKYRLMDKSLLQINEKEVYEYVMSQKLPNQIQSQARKTGCKGNIEPITIVQNGNAIGSLVCDINLALATYSGWHLMADSATILKMKNRLDKLLREWQPLLEGTDYYERIAIQQSTDLTQPTYQPVAKLSKIQTESGERLQLTTEIFDILGKQVFSTQVKFIPPEQLPKIGKLNEDQKKRLEKAKVLVLMGTKALKIEGIIVLLSIILYGGKSLYEIRKRRLISDYLLSEIQKGQELVNNGHFVAAYELVTKYLQYFPNDVEILAFLERLLDFAGGPERNLEGLKKAQYAFVEAKKIQARLIAFRNRETTALVSEGEKQKLIPLLPYSADLENNYQELLEYEKQQSDILRRESVKNEILTAYHSNMLNKALQLCSSFASDDTDLDKIKECIINKIEMVKNQFKEVENNFCNGHVSDAIELLNKVISDYNDWEIACNLQNDINDSKKYSKLRLVSIQEDFKIWLLGNNKVSIGRGSETHHPDILLANKYVSRSHAVISIAKDRVIIEDNNSTGGTYVNGAKITVSEIQNKGTIDLAKVVNMSFIVLRDENRKINTVIISNLNDYFCIVLDKMNVAAIKNKAIILNNSTFQIYYNDSTWVYSDGVKFCILKPGTEVMINDIKYRVEQI